MRRWIAACLPFFGCAAPADTDVAVCAGYPEGAVEPMAVGSVLFPYAWPDARRLDQDRRSALALGEAPCATDPDIDWSPFDVLLFVSIPAW